MQGINYFERMLSKHPLGLPPRQSGKRYLTSGWSQRRVDLLQISMQSGSSSVHMATSPSLLQGLDLGSSVRARSLPEELPLLLTPATELAVEGRFQGSVMSCYFWIPVPSCIMKVVALSWFHIIQAAQSGLSAFLSDDISSAGSLGCPCANGRWKISPAAGPVHTSLPCVCCPGRSWLPVSGQCNTFDFLTTATEGSFTKMSPYYCGNQARLWNRVERLVSGHQELSGAVHTLRQDRNPSGDIYNRWKCSPYIQPNCWPTSLLNH